MGVLSAGAGKAAERGSPDEYDIKAAFLFNFAKFVEWPSGLAGSKFTFCTTAEDPFGETLSALSRKTLHGRSVRIRRRLKPSEIQGCHVLFVGERNEFDALQILRAIDRRSILTVGDTPEFTRLGGMINFVINKRKIRFEIAPEPVRRAGLRMSSELLALARLVEEDPQ